MRLDALDEDEFALVAQLVRRLAFATPARRARRSRASSRGDHLDVRATLRRSRSSGGDPVEHFYRRRRERPRRLVALLDVSGSMAPYARAYLLLLEGAARGARAETFVFATRLTRVTRALREGRAQLALERASAAAPDWAGGTRLGEALRTFNDRFGRRGMARDAVVAVLLRRLGARRPGPAGARDGAPVAPGVPRRVGQPARRRPGLRPGHGRDGGRAALSWTSSSAATASRRSTASSRRSDGTDRRTCMRFENHFDVDAPIERVWDAVLDVERVAPTVPGAQVLERVSDDAYKVAIKVKVGPMSMTYRGEVEITDRDEAAHRAVMKARAKESRGQGTADADVTMELTGDNGRTSATVTTDVQLSGKVATMGQGVLQDVSGRLVETFAKNLATMLEAGEAPAAEAAGRRGAGTARGAEAAAEPEDALDLGSLGGAVVADRLKDPRTLAATRAAGSLVVLLLRRRR